MAKGNPHPVLLNEGRGRPFGAKGKHPQALKEMIVKALEAVGGVEYLATQAIQNPVAFMGLLGRIIPLQVDQTITRRVREMSDDELRNIASGSCARIAQQTNGESEPPSVH